MASTTVVVADDHPLVLKGIVDFLSTVKGLEILRTCSNGLEAIECIRECHPDIAVLDVEMPRMTGLEVLAAINAEGLRCKVIFIAGAPAAHEVMQAMGEGAFALLPKDAQPPELVKAIRAAMDNQRTFPFELLDQFQDEQNDPKTLPIEKLLSKKEWKVMNFAAQGLSNKEIARRLDISEGTAKLHLHHIFRKLGVKTRAALAALSLSVRQRQGRRN